jgi:glutathione S-transferase
VPALVDDDLVLYESLSINLYLARKYGGPLAPVGLVPEALAVQWSFWVTTEVEKPLLFASANRALFAEAARDEEQALMAIGKLARPFKVLNAHLAKQPFLLGDHFTVADLNVATVMDLAPQCGIALDTWPSLQAWHHQCLARPAAADWKDVKFSIPRPPTALGVLRMFV